MLESPTRMAKDASSAALILKDIRAALDSRLDGRGDKPKGLSPKSSLKTLGVRPTLVRSIARDIQTKTRPAIDYPAALALIDAAVDRKVREEILVAHLAVYGGIDKRESSRIVDRRPRLRLDVACDRTHEGRAHPKSLQRALRAQALRFVPSSVQARIQSGPNVLENQRGR